MSSLLLVTTSFPQDTPGSEAAGSFVADFAQALGMHIATEVIAPGTESAIERREGYSVHRFPVPLQPLSLLNVIRPTHWPAIASTLASGAAAVENAVQARGASHILALWALPSGYWARRVSRAHGIPYSVWALGSDIWTLGKVPVVRGVLKGVLENAAHRFADGIELARDVERLAGSSCEFLPSARQLDPAGARAPAGAPPYRLAYLGRWHPNKGVDLLLDALGRLSDEGWCGIEEVRINGGGPLEATVRESAERLRRAGRPVLVGGYLDKSQAVALFEWADWVLLPSRIESVPVVYSDAMRCQRPVVSMPVGDLAELVRGGSTGILASEVNSAAFAAAIDAALRVRPSDFLGGVQAAAERFDVVKSARMLLERIFSSMPSR